MAIPTDLKDVKTRLLSGSPAIQLCRANLRSRLRAFCFA